MKTLAKKIITAGLIGLATLLPLKEAKAQQLGGWLETTLGTPSENLRLYPSVSAFGVNVKSLIDLNNFSQFSKTDLSFSALETNSHYFAAKPVITALQDKKGVEMKAGINGSYSFDKIFSGMAEASMDMDNPRNNSAIYTYNSVLMDRGNISLGVFTASSPNDFSRTYAEVEVTLPRIMGKIFSRSRIKGISPYARLNLQKGAAPSYQAGISFNPFNFYQSIKPKKR